MFGIARDITQQKQKTENLLKSELTQKLAQHIAHMGTWEHNILSNQFSWFEGIYQILAIDPVSTPASYELLSSYIHPKDRKQVNKAYLHSLKKYKPYSINYRLCIPKIIEDA